MMKVGDVIRLDGYTINLIITALPKNVDDMNAIACLHNGYNVVFKVPMGVLKKGKIIKPIK